MSIEKARTSSSTPSEKEARIETVRNDDRSDDIDFGGESTLPPPPSLTEAQELKLWRKVDLRLMPILSLMYLFSFLDRGAMSLLGPHNHADSYLVA